MKKFLRIILSWTLCVAIFTSIISIYAIDNNVSTSRLLTKEEVLTLANGHINGYLKTDWQTADRNLTPSNDFVNLYDIDGNLYAYMVPLIEDGVDEVGYITITAIDNAYSFYEIYIKDNAVKQMKKTMNSVKKTGETAKLILYPPNQYFVQTTNNTTRSTESKYFVIDGDNITIHKTAESFQQQKNELRKAYTNSKTTENKESLSRELKTLKAQTLQSSAAVTAVADENYPIKNEQNFVNAGGSYGGNQKWYSNSNWRGNGCGPVAAANITCYLGKTLGGKYAPLYTRTMSRSDFIAHMVELYQALNPPPTGLLDLISTKLYASKKGVSLTEHRISTDKSNIENTARGIKTALSQNKPVAAINTSFNVEIVDTGGYKNDYGWHWITITKYHKDGPTGTRYIALSTWGVRRSINFKTYHDSMKAGKNYIYFS